MAGIDDIADAAANEIPGTLGEVLYGAPRAVPAESAWVALVHAVARGDQLALHALYERANRPVFTLALRMTGDRGAAEELTLDVFLQAWRQAGRYTPTDGTVLAWIMNLARSRAIDRLRHDGRLKRVAPASGNALAQDAAPSSDAAERSQQGERVRGALALLRPEERAAIEAAYFGELSYAEVAQRLNQPLGTIKSRIRSGLHKLRSALAEQESP